MSVPKPKSVRLDIRTSPEAKEALTQAAHYLGTTTSAFVLSTAVEEALRVLYEVRTIQLTHDEHQRFIEVLENPPKPNAALKRLFKKHQ